MIGSGIQWRSVVARATGGRVPVVSKNENYANLPLEPTRDDRKHQQGHGVTEWVLSDPGPLGTAEAAPRRDVGEVRHPQLIRTRRHELRSARWARCCWAGGNLPCGHGPTGLITHTRSPRPRANSAYRQASLVDEPRQHPAHERGTPHPGEPVIERLAGDLDPGLVIARATHVGARFDAPAAERRHSPRNNRCGVTMRSRVAWPVSRPS